MERLNMRERQVLGAVAKGWTNEQVAAHLERSPDTIRNTLTEIFRKLGVQNRVGAAVMLLNHDSKMPRVNAQTTMDMYSRLVIQCHNGDKDSCESMWIIDKAVVDLLSRKEEAGDEGNRSTDR